MKTSPKKDTRAQTGSNLRRRNLDSLLAHRAELRAKRTRLYDRKAREFYRQCKKVLSKAELLIATEIVRGVQKEFELASFEAGRDCARRDAIKVRAQKKLNRLLAKALPAYPKLQALKKAHLRDYENLVEAVLSNRFTDRLTVHLGNTLVEEPEEVQEFVAPFQIFNTHADDPEHLLVRDNSFANTGYSQVANNLEFHHDEDSAFNPWFLTFNRVHSASSFASCGINFTMPKTGRLKLSALLDNIANRVSFSVSDNWGFSYGNLDVRLLLFISVIRGGQISHLTRTLLARGIRSHGSDLSYTMPILMNAAPYLVNGSTEETFPTGESVQILVGSEVQIDSELDDMESRVNALMLWRLKKISVVVF